MGGGGSPGQAALWSAGKLKDEVGFSWGGMKMGWTHRQGHKGKQGVRRGGASLAVQERWRAEVHKVKSDIDQRLREVCDEGDVGQVWGLAGGGVTLPAYQFRC